MFLLGDILVHAAQVSAAQPTAPIHNDMPTALSIGQGTMKSSVCTELIPIYWNFTATASSNVATSKTKTVTMAVKIIVIILPQVSIVAPILVDNFLSARTQL